MATRLKKATFSLSQSLLAAIDRAIAEGVAPSKNQLVERALDRELREWRRQERRRLWQDAMEDPLFLKDIRDIEEAFRTADAESLRGA